MRPNPSIERTDTGEPVSAFHVKRWANMFRQLFAWAFFSMSMAGALAQSPTVESARQDIVRTYSFDPSSMSFSEQAKLAPSLTELWDRYDKSPSVYRAALRAELRSDRRPEMLYCDGGILLLHKSGEAEDRALGLNAISKCSLAEIQQTPYLFIVHQLAREGVDTLELQWKILTKPNYSAFIVAHALTLGQNYAFLYPLLLQDERRYVSRLIERLKVERDPVAQKSLVLAIWYAATPEAERALQAFASGSASIPGVVQEAAKEMIDRISEARGLSFGAQAALYWRRKTDVTSSDGESEIRAKRRAGMRSISDEALMKLDIYTPLLYRSFR